MLTWESVLTSCQLVRATRSGSWPGCQSRRSEGGAAWPHFPSLHRWLGEEGELGRLVPLGKRLQGSRSPPQPAHARVPRTLHWNPLSHTSTPSRPSDDQDPTELLEKQVHLSKMHMSTGEHLFPALPVWLSDSPKPVPAPEGPISRERQTSSDYYNSPARTAPTDGGPSLWRPPSPTPLQSAPTCEGASTSQQLCKTRQQLFTQAVTTKPDQPAVSTRILNSGNKTSFISF